MFVKILYILVSQPSDFYYEQALVSVASAKCRMPDASISLLVDSKTRSNMVGDRSSIFEYVNETVVIDLNEESPLLRSRILKTNMRSLVQGDFIYVDVDSVWTGSIDECDFTSDVMGVLDGNCELSEHGRKKYIMQQFEKIGFNPTSKRHINGGVLYMKDSASAKKFCELWNFLWTQSCEKGVCFDQPSLHQVVESFGPDFSLLNGIYNAQVAANMKYFASAKLVHYHPYGPYSDDDSRPFIFHQKKFWKIVKEHGLSDSVMKTLKHPFEAFSSPVVMCDTIDVEVHKTAIYGLLRDMYKRRKMGMSSRFDVVEKFVRKIAKLRGWKNDE